MARELSGLAASRVHPNVLYTHNDSGDTARFFAIDTTGAVLAEVALAGATAVDWEDIAVGPCPAGSCVYIADTGRNTEVRREYAIYRTPEPDLPRRRPGATAAATSTTTTYERFPFVYADGPHDAESLVVDPATGAVYVVTKQFARATAYRVSPLAAGAVLTASRVADVRLPSGLLRLATGASAHPCEARFLLRTYDRLFEYRAAPGGSYESMFSAAPVELPTARELQGEAVGYDATGRGYYTVAEGAGPTLYSFACRSSL
jgi:hypothetical protein